MITDQTGHKVAGLSEYLGHQTNNYAEYNGLLAALDYAIEHGHKALKVVADSELLVKQIRGEYKVKSPDAAGTLPARQKDDRAAGMVLDPACAARRKSGSGSTGKSGDG